MTGDVTHRERLAAAREELAALAEAERRYLDAHPYRLVHEHDMRAGEYRVRVNVVSPVPTAILGMAEQVARELRASLDALATRVAGAPAKFPVFESLAAFAQRSRKSLRTMPDAAQAAIEALQPYHAIGGYRNGPLWLLDQLASSERPRLAAGAVRDGAELGVNTRRKVDVGELVVHAGAFDDGDVIVAVRSTVVGPDPKLDLYLKAEFALAFERRGIAKGREVVELLGELAEHVEQVVFAAIEGAGAW